MAEDVSILAEIDEALRADKAEEFWARYSGIVLAFCVFAVLATAASVFWKDHLHEAHARQTGLLTQASTLALAGKYTDAIPLYEQVEKDGNGLAILAALEHANALMAMKQEDKAFALYSAIAAGKIDARSDALRDYAALQAYTLAHNRALATGKPLETVEGTKQAAADGRPYSLPFAESAAIEALAANDPKTASTKLNIIVSDDSAAFSERLRAVELLESVKEDVPAKDPGK